MASPEESGRALQVLRGELEVEVCRLERRLEGRLACRRGCASCCVDELSVLLIEADVIRAEYPKLVAEGVPSEKGRCAFLDAEGACRIYAHRPYVCRTQGLPLRWFEEADDGEILEQRDVCALSLAGAPGAGPPTTEGAGDIVLDALTEDELWLLGPYEERLVEAASAQEGGEPRRIPLRSLFRRSLSLLLALAALGCGGAPGPATRATSPDRLAATPAARPDSSAAPAGSAVASTAPAAAAGEPAAAEPQTAFPPAALTPPHPASARPGDGEWRQLGSASAGDHAAIAPALLYTTVIHPHRVSRFKSLTLVAIDLNRARLGYSPGTADLEEVRRRPAELDRAVGLVPKEHQGALVAVMNGGFKPRHGHWGMLVAGVQLVPPRPEGCTLLIDGDGRAALATHAELARTRPELSAAPPPPAIAYRQTPPCLVEHGSVHPRLQAGDDRPWGGHDPKLVTRRRSAIGIDAGGAVLFYGMGEELEPAELAEGMRAAGAASAAQLDINWSWTRFLLFGARTGSERLEVTSTLIPKMVHDRTGYVERASDRDFFFILRR